MSRIRILLISGLVAVAGLAAAAPSASAQATAASGTTIQSNAFAEDEKFPAPEAIFTPPIYDLRGHKFTGEVVHVGLGCPATAVRPEDPYLADPSGKIALIERGICRFDEKIARAQLAGAVAVIVYNSTLFGDEVIRMGGESTVALPPDFTTVVEISIPGVFVGRSVGLLLRDGIPAVLAELKAKKVQSTIEPTP